MFDPELPQPSSRRPPLSLQDPAERQADYLERGDFTIDVMMYDLPKDVQEARMDGRWRWRVAWKKPKLLD